MENPLSPSSQLPVFGQMTSAPVSSLSDTVLSLANVLMGNALLVAGALAVLYLIIAAIRYIVSRGDVEQARQARAGVIHVIIGVGVIVAAFSIIRLAIGIGDSISTSI